MRSFRSFPAKTSVIAAGVGAAHGGPPAWIVGLAAAAGVIVGDNISYLARAAHFGPPIAARFFRSEEASRRLASVAALLRQRGGTLIVVARFVPAGRTAATLVAGMVGMPWRQFAGAG